MGFGHLGLGKANGHPFQSGVCTALTAEPDCHYIKCLWLTVFDRWRYCMCATWCCPHRRSHWSVSSQTPWPTSCAQRRPPAPTRPSLSVWRRSVTTPSFTSVTENSPCSLWIASMVCWTSLLFYIFRLHFGPIPWRPQTMTMTATAMKTCKTNAICTVKLI